MNALNAIPVRKREMNHTILKIRLIFYRAKQHIKAFNQRIKRAFKRPSLFTGKGEIKMVVKRAPFKVKRPTFWIAKERQFDNSLRREQVAKQRKLRKQRNRRLRRMYYKTACFHKIFSEFGVVK